MASLQSKRYELALIVKRRRHHGDGDERMFELVVTPCPSPLTGPQSSSSSSSPSSVVQDLQLFDLPSAPLFPASPSPPPSPPSMVNNSHHVQSALHDIGLARLDADRALRQLMSNLTIDLDSMQPWKYWKYLEEPDYGPGPSLNTIFFMTELEQDQLLPGSSQWLNAKAAWELLTGGKNGGAIRLGPLAAYALTPHFPQSLLYKFNFSVKGQEYPPGVLQVPMASITRRPFSKTNLVIFASNDVPRVCTHTVVARGGALLVDPGCHPSEAQEQLATIVNVLPESLLIFLTHHHLDHTGGLRTIQKRNPQALIIAHELTIRRLGKVAGDLNCLPVTDGALVLVGDQELQIIGAPGHTDGHMALLHVATHTLIVGDHCVGQGSSVLDASSGGSMEEYLATTHKLLDLAPRVIVPMHGHFNVWPAHMLINYIRHREAREAKILTSIEQGSRTAFGVVSQAYMDTPPSLWTAALSNTKLHVDHLNQHGKLPKDFSMAAFTKSCGYMFYCRCVPIAAWFSFSRMLESKRQNKLFWRVSVGLIGSALCYFWAKNKKCQLGNLLCR